MGAILLQRTVYNQVHICLLMVFCLLATKGTVSETVQLKSVEDVKKQRQE